MAVHHAPKICRPTATLCKNKMVVMFVAMLAVSLWIVVLVGWSVYWSLNFGLDSPGPLRITISIEVSNAACQANIT